MPTKFLTTKGINNLWETLKEWDAKSYVMTAAITLCDDDDIELFGTMCQHAYTIIGTAEYQGEKLVHVRNPWGVEKYTGPWSDGDSKWTQDAYNQLGHAKKNDGTFWVPLENFKEMFNYMNVAFYEEDYHHTVAQGTLAANKSITSVKFEITNTETQDVMVGVSYESTRMKMETTCYDQRGSESITIGLRNRETGEYITDATSGS